MIRSLILIIIAVAAWGAAPVSEPAFGRLPLHFEPDGRGGFFAAGVNFDFRFAPGRIGFHTDSGSFSMVLQGSDPDVMPSGYSQLPGRSNYFAESNPESWRTNVPHYAGVRYGEVYPGVDLLFYGNGSELEFDFHLKPGVRPEQIRIAFHGANSLSVDDAGGLVVHKGGGELRFRRPVSYQLVASERREVASAFQITPDGAAAFEIGAYDRALPLVIDPVLVFSAVIGPGNISSMAVDSQGDVYVGGQRLFPGQTSTQSAFVAKVGGAGSTLIYSTFYGAPGNSGPASIVVDETGQAAITGAASSGGIPIVNALQPTRRGQDAYIAKLSADGASFVFSTFFGGSDQDFGSALALDRDGSVIVTGRTWSSDLPVSNALQATPQWRNLHRTTDGGSTWEVSSQGLEGDEITSVTVDPSEPGKLYATGRTGLHISTDAGANWRKFPNFPCGNSNSLAIHPSDNRVLYATCSASGIYKSTDRGESWRRLVFPFEIQDHARVMRKVIIVRGRPTTIYGLGSRGAIKSVDSGETWVPIDFGPGAFLPRPSISDIALDPRDASMLYAAVDGAVLKSSDGGATWVQTLPVNAHTSALTVDPITSTVYAAGASDLDRVVFKSNDKGATWSMSAPLPGARFVSAVATTPGAIFAIEIGAVFRSVDGGASWKKDSFHGLTLRGVAVDPRDTSRLWIAATEAEKRAFLLKLSPNGQSIQFATYLGPNHPKGVAADVAGNVYVAGIGVGLEQSKTRLTESACRSDDRLPIFVTKLDSNAKQAAYSFCLDMTNPDARSGFGTINGLAVDETGNAYAIGITADPEFPIESPVQPQRGGDFDGFLFKLGPAGDSLFFSTFLGGDRYDEPKTIVASGEGHVVIAGVTDSRDFPVTPNAIQPAMRGARWYEIIFPPLQSARARFGRNGFVSVIDTNQPRLVYSSYLGGSRFDQAVAVAVDPGGRIIVAGDATSPDFPRGATPPGADQGGEGMFVSKIDLAAQQSSPDLRAVTDAASFLSGRISASEIITLFGSGFGPSSGVSFRLDELGQLPLTLGGARVLINGSPIPLLYVSAGQINAIAPGTLTAGDIAAVEVEIGGAKSLAYRVEVAPAAPGIFTLTGAGFGPAAALNQDLTVNSAANAAARGSVIVLYATGPGPTDTPFANRHLTPLTPPWPAPTGDVVVLIGDRAAKILYAGAAPGLVPGVLQINAEIPMEVNPGPNVPIGISIGGVSNDPALLSPKPTIAVK